MSNTAQSESLSSDIAFIRNLVEEGQRGGYRGEIGVAAGLIWGTASLYDWAIWAKVLNPIGGYASVGWIWAAAAALFAIVGIPLGMYRRIGNRVGGAAWAAVGFACWTLTFVVALAAWRLNQWVIFTLLPPMVMTLYGGAWLVSAAAFRRYWMVWVGVLSLLSSLLLAYVVAQPVEYLLFALCLYLLCAAPCLYGMLRNRAAA